MLCSYFIVFSALTLLVGWQEWLRWEMVSPDGVAPSQMVSVSACLSRDYFNLIMVFWLNFGI